jgi:2-methylcitrate dehydratase PrpD
MMLRTARAINPSHLKRGFHTTGTAGSLGAAAGAGRLLSLPADRFAHCVAMGGLQSAGIQEMLHSNPAIKPLQAGKAAMAGVLSADLAALGAAGPASLFEGAHGWLKAMADNACTEHLTAELGSRWEICNTYTKLYPTCRHCHHAIDLAIGLFAEGVAAKGISNIQIDTYKVAIDEVGSIVHPVSLEEAMFSLPYAVAVALTYGTVRLQTLASGIEDKTIQDLAGRVVIREDAAMNAVYPSERGSRLTVEPSNGALITRLAKLPKGEFDTPLTDEECLRKAWMISEEAIPIGCFERLWKVVVATSVEKTSVTELLDAFLQCERSRSCC